MSAEHDDDWAEPVQYVGRREAGDLGPALAQASTPALDFAPIQFQPRRAMPPPRTTSSSSLNDHIERLLGFSSRMSQQSIVAKPTSPEDPDFAEFEQAGASSTSRRVRIPKPERDSVITKRPIGNDRVERPRRSTRPLSQLIAADIDADRARPRPARKLRTRTSFEDAPASRQTTPPAFANDPIEPVTTSPTLSLDDFDRIESRPGLASPTLTVTCDLGKRPSWVSDFDFDADAGFPSPRPAVRRRAEVDSHCDSGHRPRRGAVGELCSRLKLIECRLVSSRSIFHNNVASSCSTLDTTTLYLILTDVFYTRFDLHLCSCRSWTQDGACDSFQLLISDDEWHANALQIGALIRVSCRDLKKIWQPPGDLSVIAATSFSVETQITDELRLWVQENVPH